MLWFPYLQTGMKQREKLLLNENVIVMYSILNRKVVSIRKNGIGALSWFTVGRPFCHYIYSGWSH